MANGMFKIYKKKLDYLIGKFITGRNTFLYSSYKPNSAGTYRMRDKATIYNIQNLVKLISKVSIKFKNVELIDIHDLRYEERIKEKLIELFNLHGSDKSYLHNYEIIYAHIFMNLPESINLLEIGLGTNNTTIISNMGKFGKPGASLRAFSEFLPESNLFGADVDKNILFESSNIRTFYIDQTNYETYSKFLKSVNYIKFDLIIDDGLHLQSANINTLYFALENLKNGGYLVVEDVPEFALDTWKIVKNLLNSDFELNIIKTKINYVILVKNILV